ncbi:hypothetical protein L207DRAFT_121125 [Hyaloscypha variabilis F]|uniref:Uncharacterized protein n=1 Tax=Hyaloscypha variabilis (strain UAMH 11265 / GT02V1 / F) TaxID=1149755 RepID=A0A2J6RB33_HYAVF|nr:hypothetical protein L207DRAFT_121125 [Hyaloscypha variabilis F]
MECVYPRQPTNWGDCRDCCEGCEGCDLHATGHHHRPPHACKYCGVEGRRVAVWQSGRVGRAGESFRTSRLKHIPGIYTTNFSSSLLFLLDPGVKCQHGQREAEPRYGSRSGAAGKRGLSLAPKAIGITWARCPTFSRLVVLGRLKTASTGITMLVSS